ncbi:hypothetical protein Kpol_1008p16 [Vanderwaltozyma polyspora DSM 70294]|uniref:Uncharacterized protein n=1 Tax=Vanderwaltozyma polyspora (strain ATCC 22028 / DSM 70294 / BCRC 21397 / CBS 2163 / NBRC 10782 / NRRL Y-8283 / UCD 57-17) TaxID=436907 RepID=A7TPY0_VANPO|nr:uncharacterized protein Kpol_1008p16 [Vanderwaltozyma polyspora DSM 70294]EDO15678.1 hypothetical protein Kpol_1008p16 [Vanderwaltozyma polyspora DSM 70294]
MNILTSPDNINDFNVEKFVEKRWLSDIRELDLETNKWEILKSPSFKNKKKLFENIYPHFDFIEKRDGRIPRFCLRMRVTKSKTKHQELLNGLRTRIGKTEPEYYSKNKARVSDIFGLQRDSETLDDSEIDMLMQRKSRPIEEELLGQNQEDKKIESGPYSPLMETDDESFEEDTEQELDGFKETYLLVSENSIFEVGSLKMQLFKYGINDCKIYENAFDQNLNNGILVLENNGILLNLIPNSDDLSKLILLQYWTLGNGCLSNSKWTLVLNDFDNSQFIAVNKELGKLKFFQFKNELNFQLVNNLDLENTKIIDCVFLQNITLHSEKKHYIVFAPMIRFGRIAYICIEWDSSEPKSKSVHQLTLLNTNEPLKCIPIGSNNVLVYSVDSISLVSANQIMSGETSFENFRYKQLRGLKSFFQAPLLVNKLKIIDESRFENAEYCTLMFTGSGNICMAVMFPDNLVKFFYLTKFKGLLNVCPVKSEINLNPESNFYEIIVISFGRTLTLTVDLSQLYELTEQKLNRSNMSLNGIVKKHTLDSSSELNTDLLCVPSRSNFKCSELWLTSSMAISNLSMRTGIRKVHTHFKLHQFQIFNRFFVINHNNIPDDFKDKIFDSITSLEYKKSCLIVATDSISVSRAYILEISNERPQLIDMDDLLCETSCGTLAFYFTKARMVQISTKAVYVDSLDEDDLTKKSFSPSWELEGTTYWGNECIVWNKEKDQVWHIDDIEELGDKSEFKEFANLKNFTKAVFQDFVLLSEKSIALKINDHLCIVRSKNLEEIKNNKNEDFFKVLSEDGTRFVQLEYNKISYLIDGPKVIYFKDNDSIVVSTNLKSDFTYTWKGHGFGVSKIRKVSKNNYLIFSSSRIAVVYLENEENSYHYELKVPYSGKFNPILDIRVDDSSKMFYVLFADGLHVLDPAYFTFNLSNFLLKSTRSLLKKFIYVEKMNRLIVTNIQSNEWDCVKLADGKSVSLDATVLMNIGGSKLTNVLELPSQKGSNTILLLVSFESAIKLVKLDPRRGGIDITELNCYSFDLKINNKIIVKPNGNIYIFANGSFPSYDRNISNDPSTVVMDKLYCFNVVGEQFVPMKTLEFNGSSLVTDFDVCGENIIFTTSKWNKLYGFRNFSKSCASGELELLEFIIPLSSYIIKIKSIDENCFVVATRCEGRSEHVSELLFFDTTIFTDVTPKEDLSLYNVQREDRQHIFDAPDKRISNEDASYVGYESGDNPINNDNGYPIDLFSEEPYFTDDEIDWEGYDYISGGVRNTGVSSRITEDNRPDTSSSYPFSYVEELETPSLSTNLWNQVDKLHFEKILKDRKYKQFEDKILKGKDYYMVVPIEKLVKNLTYDKNDGNLYVLTQDQTVFQFQKNCQATNSTVKKYYIPSFKHNFFRNQITESGYWPVSNQGSFEKDSVNYTL